MKRFLKVFVCSVVLAGLLNSCFGSFGATRWLWKWNDSFGNKFVKTIIYWLFIIIPAYELFMFADFWIINLIEFFTGSNPIGNNIQYIPNDDGTITAMGDNGESMKFTAVSDNRMIVERNGVVLGEVAIDGNKNMVMTNYANAEVETIDLSGVNAK